MSCAIDFHEIEKTIDLKNSRVLNMESYRTVVFRRRIMFASCIFAWIAVVILIAAIAIPKWEILTFTNIDWEIVRVELGVWGEWRHTSNTSRPMCMPQINDLVFSRVDSTLLRTASYADYYRAQAAVAIIALVLLIGTNILALYTFYHHRYTYKRLTAALYFVIAICVIISIEVLANSVEEWNTQVVNKSQLEEAWDYDAVREGGIAKYLAWTVVVICAITSVSFLIGSHKQKGENAATAEFEIEDRPVHIGRD